MSHQEPDKHDQAGEIRKLRACVNGLVSLLALPALWADRGLTQMLDILLDSVLRLLQADFVYARAIAGPGTHATEAVRFAPPLKDFPSAAAVGHLAKAWLTEHPSLKDYVVPGITGPEPLSVVHAWLGPDPSSGTLIAGALRPAFPSETDILLLRVAANQAGMELQHAHAGHGHRAADIYNVSNLRVSPRFDPTLIGMAIVAPDETFLEVNQRFCDMLGYSRDEILRMRWPGIFSPDELAAHSVRFERQRGHWNGRTYVLEVRLIRKDGRSLSAYKTAQPVYSQDNSLKHVVTLYLDRSAWERLENTLRTERQDLEEKLIERAQQFAAVAPTPSESEPWPRQVESRLRKILSRNELRKELAASKNLQLDDTVRTTEGFDKIIGRSAALQSVMQQVSQVAPTDVTVLLEGETGTGKELFAEAVHRLSKRRDRIYVKLNCAAVPVTLIESELFGHEKGAFTGALAQRAGRFEVAQGGTLFLDEIGELPLELQAKLLRVLQSGEFERIGSSRTQRVNVRVIAATNRKLADMVAEGRFRNDLYYRLNVFPVHVPPLRERTEDVPLLLRHFARRRAKKYDKPITAIDAETIRVLSRYSWPGNVRELQNLVTRAVIMSSGPLLRIAIPGPVSAQAPAEIAPADTGAQATETLDGVERQHILSVLAETHWVVSGRYGAAAKLGMKRSTLQHKMQRLGIVRPQ